jgi:hypothetical protein
MHRITWVMVIGALAMVLGVVEAGPAAAAKGGNNDTAKICQRGGWGALVARSGEVFANQGDCVNDGAQADAPFGTAGRAACLAIHGTFVMDDPRLWQCSYGEGNPPNYSFTASLSTACDTDTNSRGFFDASGPSNDVFAYCEI